MEAAARLAGTTPKIRKLGGATLTLVGFLQPMMRELKEMLGHWEAPFVVDHGKFASTFGTIATPLDAALLATLDWHRRSA